MMWSFLFVTLLCELGEMITSEYDKVDKLLLTSKWYEFPIKMQRMLVMMTVNAQKSVSIRVYGNIVCKRTTLKKVNKVWCLLKIKID